MNYVNIVVYNNITLFNILNELEPNLNFKIEQFIKEKKNLQNILSDNPKTLVITTDNLSKVKSKILK